MIDEASFVLNSKKREASLIAQLLLLFLKLLAFIILPRCVARRDFCKNVEVKIKTVIFPSSRRKVDGLGSCSQTSAGDGSLWSTWCGEPPVANTRSFARAC